MTAKRFEMDMCNGPILPKMLKFTLPLIFSSILQLLFNAADIIVVGKFAGDDSLAAVGSTSSLIHLLTNLFIGLSIGSNILAAKDYGSNKYDDLSRTLHTSISLSIISGIVLTVIGIFGARDILILMHTPEEVLDLAVLYLQIYFTGMTASMVFNFGSAVMRAIGDTKRPLFFLVIAGVINVALNILFVIVFNMDVAGVAIATSISQFISAICIIVCLLREKGSIKLVFSKLRISKDRFIKIMKIGLPTGIQGVLFALSNVVIQSSINDFGPQVIAGNSASANIEDFIYVSMNCFYQATITFTSQNIGAGNIHRIKPILLRGLACVTLTGMILGGLVVLFGRPLLGIYSDSMRVVEYGFDRLYLIAGTYALCGIMEVVVGSLRGIGYSLIPTIVSLLGACVFRLIWLATIFQLDGFHTTFIIYISYPVSWIITLVAHFICYAVGMRNLKKTDQIYEKEAC